MNEIEKRLQNLSPERRQLVLQKLRRQAPANALPSDGKPPLVRIERNRDLPLSFAQQRLWFLDQMEGASQHYNEFGAHIVEGPLDVDILKESLAAVMQRHEILRTTFSAAKGTPVQIVHRLAAVDLTVVSNGAEPAGIGPDILSRLSKEIERPFDLAAGPLARFTLFRVRQDLHVLLLIMHHIVCDKWSAAIFVRETAAMYQSLSLGESSSPPELPVQYADYAWWQRQWLRGEILEEHLDFWRRRLAGDGGAPPLLDLPADRPRPAGQSLRGSAEDFEIDRNLTERLKILCREAGATLFMVLHSAFAVLLGRLSGQNDFVIGVPVANRDRSELESLIGFFVNTLAIRADLSGNPSFLELLERIKKADLEAYEHQDLPFERLVEALHPSRNANANPIFQIMFALQNVPAGTVTLPGLTLRPLRLKTVTAKFDLFLSMGETGDGMAGSVEYRTDLYDRETIRRWIGYYERVLRAVAEDPLQRVVRCSEIELLSGEERRTVVEVFNATGAGYPSDRTVSELFEEQAEKTPGSVAVSCEGRDLSYRELDQRSNALARELKRRGVGPETVVGICMDRSPEMIVALLGTLKAGGAYLVLDPAYPAERLSYMRSDAQASVVVAGPEYSERIAGAETEVIRLDGSGFSERGGHRPPLQLTGAGPRNLGYIIYTSGSTGTPKGVMVEQKSMVRLVKNTNYIEWDGPARVLQTGSMAFDASTLEVWGPLLNGGRLVLAAAERLLDAREMGKLVRDHAITHMWLTSSWCNQLIESDIGLFAGLKHLLVGGERLSAPHMARLREAYAELRVTNGYGPTENTTFTTCYEIGKVDGEIPIGKPIANTRVYILDERKQPAPLGVKGELWAAGDGVARGYLNAGLTSERFVPDPFRAGERMYRTGDLGRWRGDGNIEYLGRVDDQVKIRGYRIEPGEIEAALKQHEGVKEAVVLARGEGARRLAAFVVLREKEAIGQLRPYLEARLPAHMIPAAFVALERLPLNLNGKVDREALPEPEFSGGEREYVGPRTEVEDRLAAMFAEVLRVERAGIHDNFFELGGHSLLATQLVSRVREGFAADVPLREFFNSPTVAGLARYLESARLKDQIPVRPPIRPVSGEDRFTLSFAQQRLWFLDQLEGGSAYNIFAALRLTGSLHIDALEWSLSEIRRRHETLRTAFPSLEGVPRQVVSSDFRIEIPIVELGTDRLHEARLVAASEADTEFDLTAGPLLRAKLLRLDSEDYILLISIHHIISDGWSMSILIRELTVLYESRIRGLPSPLPELAIQYSDFAHWQRSWLRGQVLETQLGYWRQQLQGAPALLRLPTDRPRPVVRSAKGGVEYILFDRGLARALAELSRREGATLFMTLLAALVTVLHRHSHQDDIVVGSGIANRNLTEAESLIGFFVNTLPLRADLRGKPTFLALLDRIKKVALDAYTHQDIPFEKLIEELQPDRSLSYTPIFQVVLTMQNLPPAKLELPGLKLTPMHLDTAAAKFDLTVFMDESDTGLRGALVYSTDLYEGETIRRWIGHYERVLRAVAEDPLQRVDTIELLSGEERRTVVEVFNAEFNATGAGYPSDRTVSELFEEQAEKTPGSVAVSCEGRDLNYRELDQRSNALARELKRRGVGPETVVGICMDRSPEMIVALLGTLKAGGAYLVLDPAYPVERLSYMRRDAQAPVVVAGPEYSERIAGAETEVIGLDGSGYSGMGGHRPPLQLTGAGPENLGYVIYTSGSTGTPKGVMVEQRSMVRLVKNTNYIEWGGEVRVLQTGSMAFDASTLEVWGPLLNGGRLVLAAVERLLDAREMRKLVRDHAITHMWLTSSWCNQLIESDIGLFAGLKHLLVGGERLSAPHMARLREAYAELRITNGYGPTENTTFTTCYEIGKVDGEIPIGKPIANTRVYILDERKHPAPLGVKGELWAAGPGVARGYLNHAGLTSERFVPDPFRAGERMYRTGDLGRWRRDGNIEYLGRVDDQVKIRGYRIEPGEIEAALKQHEGVKEAVVLARGDGARRLAAFVVLREKEAMAQLRPYLEARLPAHMIPAAFVALERLPLNLNGKVDREALPEPEFSGGEREYVGPRTEVEERLAAMFAEVLRVERAGIHDNFFELGGHSLLATQLVSRVRESFSIELPLQSLFQAPTVAGLAEEVMAMEKAARIDAQPIARIDRSGHLPLSFAQERLWFLNQLEPGNPFYNVPLALALAGPLDCEALDQSIQAIVARHEALRTTFHSRDGAPVQRIAPGLRIPIARVDLSLLPAAQRKPEMLRLALEEARRPFDLTSDALFRVTLVRLDEADHTLFLTMHHIVSDGWSLGVLIEELARHYLIWSTIGSSREPQALPDLPVQYVDFAAWQRRQLTGDILDAQLKYWKGEFEAPPPILTLPGDRTRPPAQSFRGSHVKFVVNRETTKGLYRLSRASDATLFMTLLTAFAALLFRYTGQDDMVIGSPIANRTRREIEPLIGFFVNTLALRMRLSGDPGFEELLDRVRRTALGAYAHQDLPFERLVDELQIERDLSLNPLFQVMFALQNAPIHPPDLPELRIRPVETQNTPALFDLVLDIWETGDTLTGMLEYNTDLFEEDAAARMAGGFQTLLDAVAVHPQCRVSELPLLGGEEERRLLEEWTGPRIDYPVEKTLHQLFAETAAAFPHRVAAIHNGERISYADLNQRANRMARLLRRLDVGRGDFVGILEDRGIDFLCSILAVLKAGAAFMPIDPGYPRDRIDYMIADAGIRTLITRGQEKAASFDRRREAGGPRPLQRIDLDTADLAGESPDDPHPVAAASDRAYMLYTSGSTGLPKGAIVRHNGAINHIYAEFDLLRFHRDSAFMQSAPSSSDISVWQFLAPVLIGGRTVIADYETVCDPAALFSLIVSERVTLIELVPAVMRELLEYAKSLSQPARRLPDLEWAMVTGEAVPVSLVNLWIEVYPDIPIVNAYGPTEASDDICQAVIAAPLPPWQRNVPIGQPLPNLAIYVLDRQCRIVPYGVCGEICVSGIGVGEGYWKNPEKTRSSFVPNPYAAGGRGDVLYKTGDLGRWLPGGVLECLDRLDTQVKIRGFRIETGEIESAIGLHPAVRANAVVVREDRADDKRVTAYVVPDYSSDSLRQRIEAIKDEQIGLWHSLHENSYKDAAIRRDVTFNTTGWDSNYTGQPLSESEMREYVDLTVQRIADLAPRRVLEIGCGTGLIMFALLPRCDVYTGTDISGVAISQLRALQKQDGLRSRIKGLETAALLERRADDFSDFSPASFDVALLPSVVQYFPDVGYLVNVLQGLLRVLAPEGAIFLGDVRSLPLLEAFHASVQLFKAPDSLPVPDLVARIQRQVAQEQEMAIDPAFFVMLKNRFARIASVEILPKRGFQQNEMTRFRYDVVLRLQPEPAAGAGETPGPGPLQWTDWQDAKPSVGEISERLSRLQPGRFALRRVSNRRVEAELVALRWLARSSRANATVLELKEELRSLQPQGLEPEDLWAAAAALNYRAEIGWGSSSEPGCFDVVFSRLAGTVGAVYDPPEPETKPWSSYANNPLQEKLSRELDAQLREFLKQRVPNYMAPSDFVFMHALPLTPAGKVDRLNLPRPVVTQSVFGAYVAPVTREEKVLEKIWSDILGVDRVGITQNFFELGGHSLKATRVVSRIHRDLQAEIALRDIFSHPTIQELAGRVRAAGSAEYRRIEPMPEAETYPLSHAQRRLWVLAQTEEAEAVYNIPVALLLEGQVDRERFQAALDRVVERHESLRTAFVVIDGEPRQQILPSIGAKIAWIDLSADPAVQARARDMAMEDARRVFDLTEGGLIRCALLKLAEARYVCLFNMHHIVSDDWSLGVLVREFMQFYGGRGGPRRGLRIQYRDYACWQNMLLEGEEAAVHRRYWHHKLSGPIPVLDLPSDLPRPAIKTYRGKVFSFDFDRGETEALISFGRRRDASLFMTLMATVKALLYRYTNQEDIIVGFPIAGRNHADLEDQIGFYVNMLPLRDSVLPDMSFEALLEKVKASASEAYEHQIYPFDSLVDELNLSRDISRSPMFDVILVLQNAETPSLSLEGLTIRPFLDEYDMTKFDLSFTFEQRNGRLRTDIVYNTDLFTGDRIERMGGHLRQLVKSILAAPSETVAALNILPDSERERVLVEFNPVREFRSERTLVQWFEEQAERTPDNTAVSLGGAAVSYRLLNQRSNRLARHLCEAGIGPNVLVGICLERSIETIIGILGILKAGGAYLPLDPSYPEERLAFMLQDSGVRVLLTETPLAARFQDRSIRILCVDGDDADDDDDDSNRFGDTSCGNPLPAAGPDDTAYLIYTSGSTGKPKGVLVTHRNVLRLFTATDHWFAFNGFDVWTLFHSHAFDFSVWEIWGALLYGGRLVVVPHDTTRSPAAFYALLEKEGVTVLNQTPSAFKALIQEEEFSGARRLNLRYVIFGGEALEPRSLRPWLERHGDQQPRLINMYGITETTVHVTYRQLSREDTERGASTIGIPIPDLQVYILDRSLQPVPIGIAGELVVGGAGVAKGYLNRPELTNQRFIRSPFAIASEERLYRSGDLGRYLPDGSIEYLGRLDQQVKIRGFRIETGEIEAVLGSHPAVREAAVIARRRQDETRLIAYVICGESAFDEPDLRRHLRRRLPEYMIPAAFVRLAAFPLTSNGKLDRSAFPEPEAAGAPAAGVFSAPGNDLELAIAKVFSELLRLPGVSVDDNFFDLGAHSLLLVQAHNALRQTLHRDFPVLTLFKYPTVRLLASHLTGEADDQSRFQNAQDRAAKRNQARRLRAPGSSA